MTKIYVFTQPQNSAAFRLPVNGGKMEVGYTFKDGNVLMNKKATCVLANKFYQDLLESSTLYKTGVVKLLRVVKDDKDSETATEKKVQVKEVNTAGEAIDWIASEFGATVKTAKQAKELAEKNGYNLIINK